MYIYLSDAKDAPEILFGSFEMIATTILLKILYLCGASIKSNNEKNDDKCDNIEDAEKNFDTDYVKGKNK